MLYSGTGDDGTTSAFGCDQRRISKSSELPEALGALDELNALLGVVKMKAVGESRIANALREVQENLFIIQAEVAGAGKRLAAGEAGRVGALVNAIEAELPPVTGFAVAGGTELSAMLDLSRTVARRAERRVLAAEDAGVFVPTNEMKAYLNRLSSLLFALARLANHQAGVAEEHPRY